MAIPKELEQIRLQKASDEQLALALSNTTGLNATEILNATPFDLKSIQTGSFVPYEELTEQIVLSWIKEHVSGSTMSNYMHHINEVIHKEIDLQIFPKVEVGAEDMPWSPVSGSGPTPSPTMAAPL